MESDGERYATMGHHERDVAGDGSAFDDYTRDDDGRSLLESGVIGGSAGLGSGSSSSGGGGAGISVRAQPLTEPYDRYKSIELRAECYRRGTRPTRTGSKANDNKAGYLMLLRAYDMTHNAGEPNKPLMLPMDQTLQQQQQQQQQQQIQQLQQLQQQQQQVVKKRRAHSPPESDTQDPSGKSSTTAGAPSLGGPHSANTTKRRPRVRKEPTDETDTTQASFPTRAPGVTQSASVVANGPAAPAAMPFLPGDQQLATEYMRLKMQILRESREIEKTNRREEQRFKLHAELQGVITTLAQLHRLVKEYTLERDTMLLADVNQDIAYFQEQKRKIKLEVELLDRYR